jgi:hypothetical protein
MTMSIGIVVGYAWTVEEAVESRFKPDRRDSASASRR